MGRDSTRQGHSLASMSRFNQVNDYENRSDHVLGHMFHVIQTVRATSVLSVPRPLERPEAAWSNI
jgi:hypothetical protein